MMNVLKPLNKLNLSKQIYDDQLLRRENFFKGFHNLLKQIQRHHLLFRIPELDFQQIIINEEHILFSVQVKILNGFLLDFKIAVED